MKHLVTTVVVIIASLTPAPIAVANQDPFEGSSFLQEMARMTGESNEKLLEYFDKTPSQRYLATHELLWRSAKGDISYLAEKGMPVFKKALMDPDANVKNAICGVLASFGSKAAPAISDLVTLLKDKNVETRRASAWALQEIGEAAKEAIPALVQSLKDEDRGVQIYSAGALMLLGKGGDQHLGIITEGVKSEDESQNEAVFATVKRVGAQTLPSLILCLKDMNPRVRLLTTGCFGYAFATIVRKKSSIPDDAVMALAMATKDRDEEVAANSIYALSNGGESAKKAVPAIINCLKDERKSVRYSAAKHLSEFGLSARIAIPILKEVARNDKDEQVRREAAWSIAALEKIEEKEKQK
jgi:HEAT repeat protein